VGGGAHNHTKRAEAYGVRWTSGVSLFIDYLDPCGYYGIDISPDILLAAQRTLADLGL
jgi:hypothetical protein